MGGERPDIEALLLPHLDGAYNLARWLIQTDEEAQAIVHEAYLQALQEVAQFRPADSRTWLLKSVRNIAYTWIQKRGRRSKVVQFTEAFHSGPSDSKRPLYEALSKLSVEFREILVLHDIEGWTYTQLASELKVSRAMVLDRLSMARRSLRRELAKAQHRESNDS
jgi:RNA polymerase sigma-70 factor (ECF subfamily)